MERAEEPNRLTLSHTELLTGLERAFLPSCSSLRARLPPVHPAQCILSSRNPAQMVCGHKAEAVCGFAHRR